MCIFTSELLSLPARKERGLSYVCFTWVLLHVLPYPEKYIQKVNSTGTYVGKKVIKRALGEVIYEVYLQNIGRYLERTTRGTWKGVALL